MKRKRVNMRETGIALFLYKRPNHTKEVLKGLEKNNIKKLYIFSDGWKNEKDKKNVQKVRSIADSIDFCKTEIIKREKNWGLADSITDGINYVLSHHDKIIVLEDDCVPSFNFVKYIKKVLQKYENNPRIMAVSGYSPPIEIPEKYPYGVYFSPRFVSWGWGTYKKSWKKYKQNIKYLNKFKNYKNLRKKVKKAGDDLFLMMDKRLKNKNDSWAVFWTLNIIEHNGLCVNPVKSKIKNIGFDRSGTHCREANGKKEEMVNLKYSEEEMIGDINFPPEVKINKEIHENLLKYYNIDFDVKLKIRIKKILKKLGIV